MTRFGLNRLASEAAAATYASLTGIIGRGDGGRADLSG
jgi:hypothetical protein